MVSKSMQERVHPQAEELDEGWWASVLSDEESLSIAQKSQTNHKLPGNVVPMASGKPDWNSIQSLFDQDEVVELAVQGYNRGGLLVQGHGIQGFVPVSHLIDMPSSVTDDERKDLLSGYCGRTLILKVIECEPSQERVVFSERAALAGGGRRKLLFQQLRPGTIIQGIVTNVTDFGVFVDLGGVEGLVHVSELSWGRVQHPSEILQIGDRIQTQVLTITEENARVALSLKRLTPNPWESLVNCYKPGDVVPAIITTIMRFGAFARLEEGVEGLIHISSINLPPGVKDLDKWLRSGQHVQVRILHVEIERRRLGLGLVTVE